MSTFAFPDNCYAYLHSASQDTLKYHLLMGIKEFFSSSLLLQSLYYFFSFFFLLISFLFSLIKLSLLQLISLFSPLSSVSSPLPSFEKEEWESSVVEFSWPPQY